LAEAQAHLPAAEFAAALARGQRADLAQVLRECVENAADAIAGELNAAQEE